MLNLIHHLQLIEKPYNKLETLNQVQGDGVLKFLV